MLGEAVTNEPFCRHFLKDQTLLVVESSVHGVIQSILLKQSADIHVNLCCIKPIQIIYNETWN